VLAHATRCAVCGEAPAADNPLTLGDRIARANGGSLDLSNLEPQCRRCNLRIGARDSEGGYRSARQRATDISMPRF
jgi:5-methylcytosine-specific restriction endonuclease McrA